MKILVCESSQRWTVALRWGLQAKHSLVVTQSLDDCWGMLRDLPRSFVAVELTAANLEAVVQWIQELRRDFPLARSAVMCDRELAECEWLIREAGAVHVAVSPREIGTVIRLAQQHFAQVPRPEVGFRQRVWDRLAWSETSCDQQSFNRR